MLKLHFFSIHYLNQLLVNKHHTHTCIPSLSACLFLSPDSLLSTPTPQNPSLSLPTSHHLHLPLSLPHSCSLCLAVSLSLSLSLTYLTGLLGLTNTLSTAVKLPHPLKSPPPLMKILLLTAKITADSSPLIAQAPLGEEQNLFSFSYKK